MILSVAVTGGLKFIAAAICVPDVNESSRERPAWHGSVCFSSLCYDAVFCGEITEEPRRAWVGSGEGSRAGRCLDGQGNRPDRERERRQAEERGPVGGRDEGIAECKAYLKSRVVAVDFQLLDTTVIDSSLGMRPLPGPTHIHTVTSHRVSALSAS